MYSKHFIPFISFNISRQSPTRITPPLPIHSTGVWISFWTWIKESPGCSKDFIKPSTTRNCEKIIGQCFQDDRYKWPYKKIIISSPLITLALTSELNTEDTEMVMCNLSIQEPFYSYSWIPPVKSQSNINTVPKYRKSYNWLSHLHFIPDKTKTHALIASLSSKQLLFVRMDF